MGHYEEMKTTGAKMQALAPQIAAQLGWKVEPKKRDYEHYVQIHGPAGEMIGLGTAHKPGQINVSAAFPDRDEHGTQIWSIPYGQTSPTMNVSADKSAAQIASDIARRFMPEYNRLFVLCMKGRGETASFRSTSQETARKLAGIIGGKVEGSPDRPTLNTYRSTRLAESLGDIEISGESVTFNHFSVSGAEAEAMLKALIKARS